MDLGSWSPAAGTTTYPARRPRAFTGAPRQAKGSWTPFSTRSYAAEDAGAECPSETASPHVSDDEQSEASVVSGKAEEDLAVTGEHYEEVETARALARASSAAMASGPSPAARRSVLITSSSTPEPVVSNRTPAPVRSWVRAALLGTSRRLSEAPVRRARLARRPSCRAGALAHAEPPTVLRHPASWADRGVGTGWFYHGEAADLTTAWLAEPPSQPHGGRAMCHPR